MPESTPPAPPPCTVFLSYASEDRAVAARLAEALRAKGIDVWFDANELRGGDAWDDKIRRQIKTCTFFIPIISDNTQAREEGYFRREWRLAVERAHDMADDRPFILPLTLIPVRPEEARVPKSFLDVQWFFLPDGSDAGTILDRLLELRDRLGRPVTRAPFAPPAAPATRRVPRRLPALAALLAATLALGIGGWWISRVVPSSASPAASSPATTAVELQTIAVLPFQNITGDAGEDFLADGLAEELLSALGRETGLRVVARTSSYAYRGKGLPIPEIARALGAGKLVEGSLRRAGSKLKVVVQVITGTDGFTAWTRDYEIDRADLFETQAAIANDVVAQLFRGDAGRPSVIHRSTTRNREAYEAFLRGRTLQAKDTPENLLAAVRYYEQAVGLDPQYAVAWARLGMVRTRLHIRGSTLAEANPAIAYSDIKQALTLDPELAEAHSALGFYFVRDWKNLQLALKQGEIARQTLPNDSDNLILIASCHLNLGQRDEAVRTIRQALLVDPQNIDVVNLAATLFDAASLYAESEALRARGFEMSSWPGALIEGALTIRNWHGDPAAVLKAMDVAEPALVSVGDRNFYWRMRAGFLRGANRGAEARAAAEKIESEVIPSQLYYHTRPLHRALAAEAAGDSAAARTDFEAALALTEAYRATEPDSLRAYTVLAVIYAALGREAEARAAAQTCLQLVPPTENPYIASRTGYRVLAQVEARCGHLDAALEIVRKQIAGGYWKRHDLLLDADWALLRRDPRFLQLAQSAPL